MPSPVCWCGWHREHALLPQPDPHLTALLQNRKDALGCTLRRTGSCRDHTNRSETRHRACPSQDIPCRGVRALTRRSSIRTVASMWPDYGAVPLRSIRLHDSDAEHSYSSGLSLDACAHWGTLSGPIPRRGRTIHRRRETVLPGSHHGYRTHSFQG
jgi:hypothetical protein